MFGSTHVKIPSQVSIMMHEKPRILMNPKFLWPMVNQCSALTHIVLTYSCLLHLPQSCQLFLVSAIEATMTKPLRLITGWCDDRKT